jgi:hypothetical protein
MMDIAAITDALESHAAALGYFERVNFAQLTNQPGNGLGCSIWADAIGPARGSSGLDSTSSKLNFMVRLYTSAAAEPIDAIDPEMLRATSALMAAYSGDFDLGGTIRNVDLLGQFGVPLSGQAGYLELDGKMYRVMTITLPLIVNDVWDQVS